MKVKMFSYDKLEERINKFLVDNPSINIQYIKQSSATDGYGDDHMTIETVVSIWYTD